MNACIVCWCYSLYSPFKKAVMYLGFLMRLALMYFCCIYASVLGYGQLTETRSEHRSAQLYLSIMGSLPAGDFGSNDVFNEDAGFAEAGFGFGFSGQLYFKDSNSFFYFGVAYMRRNSKLWETTLPLLQESFGTTNRGAVLQETRYRHAPFKFGFGRRVGLGATGASAMLQAFGGFTYNGISRSGIRVGPNNTELAFESDGSIGGCFGAGLCLETNASIAFELEYLQMILPVSFAFRQEGARSSASLELPLSMLNVKLMFALVKP